MSLPDEPPLTYKEIEERVSAIARRSQAAPAALLDILHAEEAFVFFGGNATYSHAPTATDHDRHDRDATDAAQPAHAALVKSDIHSSGESPMPDGPDDTHEPDATEDSEGPETPLDEEPGHDLPPEEPEADPDDAEAAAAESLGPGHAGAAGTEAQGTSDPMFFDDENGLVPGEDTGEGPDDAVAADTAEPSLPPEDTAGVEDISAPAPEVDEDLGRAAQDLEAAAELPSDADPGHYYDLDDTRPESSEHEDHGDNDGIVAAMYDEAEADEEEEAPDELTEAPPLPAVEEDAAALAVSAEEPEPEPTHSLEEASPRTGLMRVAALLVLPVGLLVAAFAVWSLIPSPSDGPVVPEVIPTSEPPVAVRSVPGDETKDSEGSRTSDAAPTPAPTAEPDPPSRPESNLALAQPPPSEEAAPDASAAAHPGGDARAAPETDQVAAATPVPDVAAESPSELHWLRYEEPPTVAPPPPPADEIASASDDAPPDAVDTDPLEDAPPVAAEAEPAGDESQHDPLMDHDDLVLLSKVIDEHDARIGTPEVPREPDISRFEEPTVWGAPPRHPDEVLRELLRDAPASIDEEQFIDTKDGHDLAGLGRRVLTQEEDLRQRFAGLGDRAQREAQLAGSGLDEGKRIEGYDYLAPSGVFDGALIAHEATGAVFRAIVGTAVAFEEGAAHGVVAVHDVERTAVIFEDGYYIGGPGSPRMPVSGHYYYRGPRTAVDGMFLYDRRTRDVVHADHRTILRFGESEGLPLLFDHGGHRIHFGPDASAFVIPDPDVDFWAEMGTAWTVIDVYLDPSGVERHVLHDLVRGGYLRAEVGAPGIFPLGGQVQAVTASGALIVNGTGAVHRGSLFLRTPRPPALLREAGENPTVAVAP